MVNFLRNCQTVFQSGLSFTLLLEVYMSFNSFIPLPHSVWWVFFMLAFLGGVEWYLTVVLTYIFLMINDVVHLSYAYLPSISSVQSLSRLTLCNSMDCSTPDFLDHHQLPESTQTHVHRIGDAIQPSHPLSSPSPALNLSQQQGLFKRVSSSHQVAKILEFQLQNQCFQ